MATCTLCYGSGGRYGDYAPCYRCSGSGTGGFTNVACIACGGSGRGSERRFENCYGCGGSGTVADPIQPVRGRRSRQQRAPARKAPGSDRDRRRGNIVALFLIGTGAGAYWLVTEQGFAQDWPTFAIAGVVTALALRFWRPVLALGVLGAIAYFAING